MNVKLFQLFSKAFINKILMESHKENLNSFHPLSTYPECKECGNHGHMTEGCENQSSSSRLVENSHD